jgi:cold shock CspA family protein
MTQSRQEGTLTTWNDPQGCGVITTLDGKQQVPVHRAAFPDDGYLPTLGEVLAFEWAPGTDGMPIAARVQRFAEPASVVAKAGRGKGRTLRLSKSPRQATASAPSKVGQRLAVLVLIILLAVVGYTRYAKRVGQTQAAWLLLAMPAAGT